MIDTWFAQLADGRCFSRDSPELQVTQHSPWRELERLAGQDIVVAGVYVGVLGTSLHSEGHPLVCGQNVRILQMVGPDAGPATLQTIRWVRREEPTRWVYHATDGSRIWQAVAPPGTSFTQCRQHEEDPAARQ